MNFKDFKPDIAASCFIAENATLIGKVIMKQHSSLWFHSVIRGDQDLIQIGEMSNIQDHCTLHTDLHHIITIKDRVTIGHRAVIHGCSIEDECLIGMGAIILNDAHIGKHCIVGAGALVREHQIIPENSIVVGNPARIVKQISDEQIKEIIHNAQHYAELAQLYKNMDPK